MTKPYFLLTISVTLLFILLQGFGEKVMLLLRYENTALQSGEWWRLLSGHFVHLSWTHLILNLAGLWTLYLIFNRIEKPILGLTAIMMLTIGISLELLKFSPSITWYVGFSGVLHGLIVIGALSSFRSEPLFALLLLVGITAKLLWEQFYANTHVIELTIGGKVIYDAHLYGAITGVVIITFFNVIFLSKCKFPRLADTLKKNTGILVRLFSSQK